MNVLVTGCCGFVGSHAAQYFSESGHVVFGIDNLTQYELLRTFKNPDVIQKNTMDFLGGLKNFKFFRGDCRNFRMDENVDLVVHCAAQPAMTIAIEDPVYDMENNIKATQNMLELARKKDSKFINCSSIHVYGNRWYTQDILWEEDAGLNSNEMVNEESPILQGDVTPLHVSKRATELYTQSYNETYGLRATSFRLTGMYGPRQFGNVDHGWVANFAIRTALGRPITIFGTDKQVRDVLFASDVTRAFGLWAEKCVNKRSLYTIGGGEFTKVSLGECLKKLKSITGKEQDITVLPERFGDAHYFVCDSKFAFKDFGWKPQVGVDDGLKELVDWVLLNREVLN
jgi:CDP-paratose 2-epimerase